METLIIALHVVAAVFLIGPMAILPHTGLRSLRTGTAAQVRGLTKSINIFSLLSLIVLVLGFAALGLAPKKWDFSFGDTWIWLSIVLYALALALMIFVVVPQFKAAADAMEAAAATETTVPGTPTEAPAAPARPKQYGAIAGSAGVATLALAAVVVLMVWRP